MRLHRVRIRVWLCGTTVLWIVLIGTVSHLWFYSYDSIVDCLYDTKTKTEWCLYRGSLYGWHHTYIPSPKTRFERFSTSTPDSVQSASYRISLWIPMLIVTVTWPTVLGSCCVYKSWRKHRRRLAGYCVNCAYNLNENTSGICPECGTTIKETQQSK